MQKLLLIFCLISGLTAQTQAVRWNNPQTYQQSAAATNPAEDQRGFAVYYADYYEGNPTALGEIFHQNLMTAAHQQLPLGTIVKVTRIDNGMTTTVRINDRGAFCDGCVIDLSKAAAIEIDLLRVGRTQVILTVIGFSNTNPKSRNEAIYSEPADPRFTSRGASTPQTKTASYDYAPSNTANNTALPFQPPAATQRGQINTVDARNIPANSNTDWAPSSYSNATLSRKGGAVSSPVNILDKTNANYAIQLGSYGQFSNAERHVLSLQNKGFNSVFVWQDTRSDGSLINRVVVAPFTSLAQAQDYLRDLRALHQMDGLVVQTK